MHYTHECEDCGSGFTEGGTCPICGGEIITVQQAAAREQAPARRVDTRAEHNQAVQRRLAEMRRGNVR